MNIENKHSLACEVLRVLRSGATFAIYDIMRTAAGELIYPVPWAATIETSKLAYPSQYEQALIDAGFEIMTVNDRRDFSLDFFAKVQRRTKAAGGVPPLGLHTLMQASTSAKISNMVANIKAGLIAPFEIIARKPDTHALFRH